MNILIVGGGKGSWAMRGHQVGEALGARVTSDPTAEDWAWADRVILVKRAGLIHAKAAHAAGVPIIWDALDFWSQSRDNRLTEDAARAALLAQIAAIRPAVTIGATEAMAAACEGVYIPHHTWAGLEPTPAREAMQVVGYEGNPAYLGAWRQRLDDACARRGWRFDVNPNDLRTVDLFVAFRDGQWDGWICREWKSGVKVANAIAAGRPVIGQASAAMRELTPPGSVVETVAELEAALDAWAPLAPRQAAAEACRGLAPALRLGSVADRYRAALAGIAAKVAA